MSQSLVTPPPFRVVSGKDCHRVLHGQAERCLAIIREAYVRYAEGRCINPNSYFLRYPDQPRNRIIALPAHYDGTTPVSGIKWIASYPANIERGLPRASAVVVLNSAETGYPFACLEGSIISAARTAASAAIALQELRGSGPRHLPRIGVVGAGLIARYVLAFVRTAGFTFDELRVHDLDAASSQRFASANGASAGRSEVTDLDGALDCDVVLFATTAPVPYVDAPRTLRRDSTVLHLSLRDLGTSLVKDAFNLTDDVTHVLSAGTSLQLAVDATGDRSLVAGTLGDLLRGNVTIARDRAQIFSPFGLGVLDLALGAWIYDTIVAEGGGVDVPDFFFELTR
jgi:2,3-diaminopropionate biosynthesis protein SbnB